MEYIKDKIKKYSPVVTFGKADHSTSSAIFQDFSKGIFEVLICNTKQFFARRIKTTTPIYVIFTSPVDTKSYSMLVRRAGRVQNDRIFTFIIPNDHMDQIEDYAKSYKIKVSEWPSINDN